MLVNLYYTIHVYENLSNLSKQIKRLRYNLVFPANKLSIAIFLHPIPLLFTFNKKKLLDK